MLVQEVGGLVKGGNPRNSPPKGLIPILRHLVSRRVAYHTWVPIHVEDLFSPCTTNSNAKMI